MPTRKSPYNFINFDNVMGILGVFIKHFVNGRYLCGAILFAILVTAPTLFLPTDVWDGVLLQHVSERHNYSDLRQYFVDSTWYLQYWLVIVTIELARIVSMPYKDTNAILCLLVFTIYLREIWTFATNQFKLEESWSMLACVVAAVYPTWSCLLSSVLTFHLVCIAVGLCSIRLLHSSRWLDKVIAIPLVLVSFSLQSQLVFLPVLSLIYDLLCPKVSFKRAQFPSLSTIGVFLLAVVAYLVIKIVAPPTGIFQNYQGLIINNTAGILPAFLQAVHFASFLVPLALITFLIAPVGNSIGRRPNNSNPQSTDLQAESSFYGLALILFVAGAFPYIAVGKSAILWEVNDWVGRQAFLIVFPAGLLSVLIFRWHHINANSKVPRLFVSSMLLLYLGVITSVLLLGVAAKISRQLFLSQLTSIVKTHEAELPPGRIQIVGEGLPPTVFEFYEPNYLMFQATGKSHWYTRIGPQVDPVFPIIPIILDRTDYQNIFFYNPVEYSLQRHTLVKINAEGFQGVSSMIRNAIGIGVQGKVNFLSLSSLDIDSTH